MVVDVDRNDLAPAIQEQVARPAMVSPQFNHALPLPESMVRQEFAEPGSAFGSVLQTWILQEMARIQPSSVKPLEQLA